VRRRQNISRTTVSEVAHISTGELSAVQLHVHLDSIFTSSNEDLGVPRQIMSG